MTSWLFASHSLHQTSFRLLCAEVEPMLSQRWRGALWRVQKRATKC